MRNPINISIDFSRGVGYVTFREIAKGETTHASRIAPDVDVVADRDSAGAIVGIEILDLGDKALRAADEFAHANDLAFPQHIGSVVPA